MANTGARDGDVLVLTKPVGTGIVATALKKNAADASHVAAAEKSMYTLNRAACEAMTEVGANACTDITGFGLLGHAMEMAEGSGVSLVIEAGKVPLLPGTLAYAAKGMKPGGVNANKQYVENRVERAAGVDDALYDVLYDPQTSGGLLIALPEARVPALLESLAKMGVETAAAIGTVTAGEKGIRVIP
jgi:selenide,water dikinase